MRGFPNLVSEKESGFMDISAGERELPAERRWEGLGYGFERLWEGLIGLKMCGDGLLYALDIESVLEKVGVGLFISRLSFNKKDETLEIFKSNLLSSY